MGSDFIPQLKQRQQEDESCVEYMEGNGEGKAPVLMEG